MNEVRVGGEGWLLVDAQYDEEGKLVSWTEVAEDSFAIRMLTTEEPTGWTPLGYVTEDLTSSIPLPAWDGSPRTITTSFSMTYQLECENWETVKKIFDLPEPEPWQSRLLHEELRTCAELGCVPHHPKIDRVR